MSSKFLFILSVDNSGKLMYFPTESQYAFGLKSAGLPMETSEVLNRNIALRNPE